jgi:2-succinyl-6-hydroxy-2,4-cyclohexadiene-1-carboxylate synthase
MPTVYLHGLLGGPGCWRGVLAARRNGRPARCLRLFGHGRPARAVPASFDAAVDELARDLDEPTTLVGYSFGGRLALALACAAPERVRAALCIGAHPGIDDEAERSARQGSDRELARELREQGLDVFVERWEALPLFESQSAAERAAQRTVRCGHDAEGVALALERLGTGSMPPLAARLGELSVPVALVAGARDEKFVALARRAARESQKIRPVVVAGAGHNVALEAPQAVARILDEMESET